MAEYALHLWSFDWNLVWTPFSECVLLHAYVVSISWYRIVHPLFCNDDDGMHGADGLVSCGWLPWDYFIIWWIWAYFEIPLGIWCVPYIWSMLSLGIWYVFEHSICRMLRLRYVEREKRGKWITDVMHRWGWQCHISSLCFLIVGGWFLIGSICVLAPQWECVCVRERDLSRPLGMSLDSSRYVNTMSREF